MRQHQAAAAQGGETILNVTRSALGRRWVERATNTSDVLAIAQRLNTHEVIARLLNARGVTADDANTYLNPSLKTDLPDPSLVTDMDHAAIRIADAIERGERMAIFGDYDVDGATSSALLARYLGAVGTSPLVYIPDRLTEGYGPNIPAMTKLAADGARVIVTVDCGTQAHDAIAAASARGADVIICDHHLPADTLPKAYAVVNPNRTDDTSGLGQLAAIGVTFLLCVALNRELRNRGFFERRTAPDLRNWLGIVALGTVADVVPLTGVNRAFVMRGLDTIRTGSVPGLTALMEVGRISGALEPYHLGFILGPRVNAGGRVGRCDLGTRLLTTDDMSMAREIALELDALNQERRAIEQVMLDEAIAVVETNGIIRSSPILVVPHEGWHPGVIGIVASRLKERYGKPAIVIAINEGIGKGSGRSVAGVNLGTAIVAAREAGLLVNGGGHAMAAGLTVDPAHIDALGAFLSDQLAADCMASSEGKILLLEGALAASGASVEFCDIVARCGPYGAGNSEPIFVLPGLKVSYSSIVGEQHVRCVFQGRDGSRVSGIAFRALQSELGPVLLKSKGREIHVAASLKADEWQGQRRVQAIIKDAAFSS
ncbi:MAG: single-stranded-DNA-specific exonuclease RecJ [Micropepsaceae bacterium]